MAAGGESVDDHTMTKAADDRAGSRQRSRRHNSQRSIGGNNNGCRDDGGKGNGMTSNNNDESRKDIQYRFLWQIHDHGGYLADYP